MQRHQSNFESLVALGEAGPIGLSRSDEVARYLLASPVRKLGASF